MPATSKAQQRLMGMAYAYKKGELDAKEASQEVKDLADSMTLKQLKKYASTKHEGLPDKVDDNLQPGDVGGMGPIKFPSATDVGSGDVPAGQGDAEEEYKKKRRKMKHMNTFESFVNSSLREAKKGKIYMALGDMEDWMPADSEVQDEYYAITNVKDMADFFEEYADTDVLQRYGLTYKDLKDLAKAALNSNESKRQTRVNEAKISLADFYEDNIDNHRSAKSFIRAAVKAGFKESDVKDLLDNVEQGGDSYAKLSKDIFNEAKVNEAVSFQELVNKYKDNPYGIGANSIEYIESENWGNQLVLRFEDSYSRKETEAELKKMGIKAKKMSKSTADKAFKYRYELTVFESKVNEEYIELPSLDEPATDLIKAFKEWYDATATDWDSFKDDMAEDSVDEAAKNAQMEILAHLSNEMNNIIKDRKFKVRADFK